MPDWSWLTIICTLGTNKNSNKKSLKNPKNPNLKTTVKLELTTTSEKATTWQQRPPFWDPNILLLLQKWPLNNDHLSTTTANLGSQGWSLVYRYDCTLKCKLIVVRLRTNIKSFEDCYQCHQGKQLNDSKKNTNHKIVYIAKFQNN